MAFAYPHVSTGTIHVGVQVKFKGADGCFRIQTPSALLEELSLKGALTFKIVQGLIAPLVFLLALTFEFVQDQIAPSVFFFLGIVQGLVALKVFFIIFIIRGIESQQDLLSRDTVRAGLLFLFGWHGGVERLAGWRTFLNRKKNVSRDLEGWGVPPSPYPFRDPRRTST